jgi:DNA (cytosine-5)-methyltransferase 1
MADFYEFFAGGGMARAGLGTHWRCLFANDFDAKKGLVYQANWGTSGELHVGDIRQIEVSALPGDPDLVWGSFPCQDLSLAGNGAGLDGERSGTFFPFWDLIGGLAQDGRAPRIVAVENVCGALTSHGGKDFEAICRTFAAAGYRYGALVINADLFIPQSRPRLFVVGVRADMDVPEGLIAEGAEEPFHTRALQRAVGALPGDVREKFIWLRLAAPASRVTIFADMVDDDPEGVEWHTQAETKKLLDMMSKVNLRKVEGAKAAGRRIVGGIYRRTRLDERGRKVQRAEVRFDDVAGCLRTPAGGSSRQVIMVIDGYRVRTRLISARETARLMGLDDNYILPQRYNDAYHLTGDGVAVPVVRHLSALLFEPILALNAQEEQAAA